MRPRARPARRPADRQGMRPACGSRYRARSGANRGDRQAGREESRCSPQRLRAAMRRFPISRDSRFRPARRRGAQGFSAARALDKRPAPSAARSPCCGSASSTAKTTACRSTMPRPASGTKRPPSRTCRRRCCASGSSRDRPRRAAVCRGTPSVRKGGRPRQLGRHDQSRQVVRARPRRVQGRRRGARLVSKSANREGRRQGEAGKR